MAHITDEEILDLAKLSNLALTSDELSRYRNEIETIIDYVEQLQSVDVSGFDPATQVSGLSNIMREDVIREQASQAELLKNAPATENNAIKVRRVLN